jgi:hypothetical protein
VNDFIDRPISPFAQLRRDEGLKMIVEPDRAVLAHRGLRPEGIKPRRHDNVAPNEKAQ